MLLGSNLLLFVEPFPSPDAPAIGKSQESDHLLYTIELCDPSTRGDPMAPLKWTCKSLENIREELAKRGYEVSCPTIGMILRDQLEYSLQGLKKTKEGSSHNDRNTQFENLNQKCLEFQERGQPVISVDTKKKELVGDFKNGGREWHPKGNPEEVRGHDFEDKELGKAIPFPRCGRYCTITTRVSSPAMMSIARSSTGPSGRLSSKISTAAGPDMKDPPLFTTRLRHWRQSPQAATGAVCPNPPTL
jgi:hypothetical protein